MQNVRRLAEDTRTLIGFTFHAVPVLVRDIGDGDHLQVDRPVADLDQRAHLAAKLNASLETHCN